MDCIQQLLKIRTSQNKTNKFYLLAEEAGKITQTKPLRWIRQAKKNPEVFEKTIVELEDLILNTQVKNRIAYWLWLLKN